MLSNSGRGKPPPSNFFSLKIIRKFDWGVDVGETGSNPDKMSRNECGKKES